jgi:hypothetical protein
MCVVGRCIQLGRYEVDCWYFSPYPDGFSQDKLYMCEYCLKYYKSPKTLRRCCVEKEKHRPPGTEIYNDGCAALHVSIHPLVIDRRLGLVPGAALRWWC